MAPGSKGGSSPVGQDVGSPLGGLSVKRTSSFGKLQSSLADMSQKAVNTAARTAAAVRRPSFTMKKSLSDKSEKDQEDEKFFVGSRYQVAVASLRLFASPELQGDPVAEVPKGDKVMLADLHEPEGDLWSKGSTVGFLVPKAADPDPTPGWAVIEEAGAAAGSQPLVKRRLPDSWDLSGRYSVANGATLRKGKHIGSGKAGDVEPGDEVLVLQFGTNESEDGVRPRLRMMVKTAAGDLVGWMSPETASGDFLLAPVNLLSPKILDFPKSPGGRLRFSRLGSASSDSTSANGSNPATPTSSPVGGRRRSYRLGGHVPWEVGGQYRVLDKVSLRDEKWMESKELKKISAGALVSILELHLVECPGLGWCPIALVTVDEAVAAEKGLKGWVRCAAKEGHDVLDTRDQLEYARVKDVAIQRLEAEVAEAKRLAEEAKRQEKEKAAEQEQVAKAQSGKAASVTKSLGRATWMCRFGCFDGLGGLFCGKKATVKKEKLLK